MFLRECIPSSESERGQEFHVSSLLTNVNYFLCICLGLSEMEFDTFENFGSVQLSDTGAASLKVPTDCQTHLCL